MSNVAIPFTKAHGAGNDFLLTWEDRLPRSLALPEVARAICDRYTGIGADGWMLVRRNAIRLFNSDGSEPEMSGNGTRCAAALLLEDEPGAAAITIATGAGAKHLKVISHLGNTWLFDMDMGLPRYELTELRATLDLQSGPREVALLNVGNPQCVVFVDAFPENWPDIGAEMERHSRFPNRTNVSFVRILDRHVIEVRFFERGAGMTQSSGTGSTGAAAASILRGFVESPVEVQTLAGTMSVRWDETVYLTGPAVIIGRGEFLYSSPI